VLNITELLELSLWSQRGVITDVVSFGKPIRRFSCVHSPSL